MYASDPSYQTFYIVILLHQDTSVISKEGFPGKKNQELPIATCVLARRQFLRPADVKDIF